MSSVTRKRPTSPSPEEASRIKKAKSEGKTTSVNIAVYNMPALPKQNVTSADGNTLEVALFEEQEIDAAGSEDEEKMPTWSGSKQTKRTIPIKTLFNQWTPQLDPVPKFNAAWGRKPMPGPAGPQSYPDQPPARTTDAQTNPPLWEDRKFRFRKGSRVIQIAQKGKDSKEKVVNIDQQEHLVLKLIDMRPKSRKDKTPRRIPIYYVYENGTPKDWGNKQTIKALNDRRQQAIDRVTMDAPWTNFEREYLGGLLQDFPNASILELTERFNWHFKNQEFAKSTAFSWDYISTGRTIESVRHEYLTYKHKYDQNEVPKKKDLADKSLVAKEAEPNRMHKFGKKDTRFDHDDSDDDDTDTEGIEKPLNKNTPLDHPSTDESGLEASAHHSEASLPDGDEELLELAGFNDPNVAYASSAGIRGSSVSDYSRRASVSSLYDVAQGESVDYSIRGRDGTVANFPVDGASTEVTRVGTGSVSNPRLHVRITHESYFYEADDFEAIVLIKKKRQGAV